MLWSLNTSSPLKLIPLYQQIYTHVGNLLEPKEQRMMETSVWDYIVIGAGNAGVPPASRLLGRNWFLEDPLD